MCTLFDEIKVEGRLEGRLEGKLEGRLEGKLEGRAEEIVESGYEFHLSERDILERCRRNWMFLFKKHRNILTCIRNQPYDPITIVPTVLYLVKLRRIFAYLQGNPARYNTVSTCIRTPKMACLHNVSDSSPEVSYIM